MNKRALSLIIWRPPWLFCFVLRRLFAVCAFAVKTLEVLAEYAEEACMRRLERGR